MILNWTRNDNGEWVAGNYKVYPINSTCWYALRYEKTIGACASYKEAKAICEKRAKEE